MTTDTGGLALGNCPHCGREFPEHLVQPMVGTGISLDMCPICALEISNKMHGIKRTEFAGEIANQYLREAKAYLAEKRREEK